MKIHSKLLLRGGGEMGELTRSFDWSKTTLGPMQLWPQSLLTILSLLLNSKSPMFLWWGPELIQFYNDAYRPSLGNGGKHPTALGQRGVECWPELWPVIEPLIDQVLSGGESIWSEDQLMPIYRNNRLEDVYWTFSYTKVDDETGNAAGVLVICNETTTKIQSLKSIKEANEKLSLAQIEAEHQRDRLNEFFMQTPAGVCILGGIDLVFELVNPRYQELFPGRKLLGKALLEAIPEIKGQEIWKILQDVYTTGNTYEGNELLIPLAREESGPVEERYFNFIYQAKRDAKNKPDGVLVFVFEVTDMVLSRLDLVKAQDNLKLAVTAAQLGTFDLDIENGVMHWDKRCRMLFGISHNNAVTYETDFLNGLHANDRERVDKVINNVFIKSISNGHYDVEYRTVGVEDHQLRWVRAMGKAYFDDQDKPLRFVGSVMDITERKQDEIRKNDFIGMVSHELKTPLTSLTALLQVLNSKLKNSDDNFISGAISKSNIQVNKMRNLIKGFLDISRLEAGKIHIDKQYFNLDHLIKEIIEEIKLTVNSHTIHFASCEPVEIYADREKIGSVVSNLLSNAVKYSPKGKNIEIRCATEETYVKVSVTDEGMGVKQHDIERLFDRYYRVKTNHTHNIAGFGIGLYLCSEIIESHEGRIYVESEPGEGSTFIFTLPIA
ncbi:two-component system sensor histidine kinase VicK [Pedobacter sp. UYEF25]